MAKPTHSRIYGAPSRLYVGPSTRSVRPPPTANPSQYGMGSMKEKKNPFLDMGLIEQQNQRENKDFGLFESYQLNPFNLESFEYVTPKIGTKPSKIDPKTIPGYYQIREALMKDSYYPIPNNPTSEPTGAEEEVVSSTGYCEPETTNNIYGWFYKPGAWRFDLDAKDERFRFGHRTADFIKEKEKLKKYDTEMGYNSPKGKVKGQDGSAKK